MLNNAPFYFGTVAKVTAAFGWIFSDIVVQRVDPNDSNNIQSIKVPIELATKEKWASKIFTDPNAGTPGQQRPISTILPRMGYAYKNFRYDPSRRLSPINFRINTEDKGPIVIRQLNPIPIVVEYTLYLRTRTLEDGFQIIEQIGAFFGPDYVVPIMDIAQMNIKRDIIFTLKSNSHSDSYDGQMMEKRLLEWEFEFEARAHLYPPIREKKLITEADIRILEAPGIVDSLMEIAVDPKTDEPSDTFAIAETTFHGEDALAEEAASPIPYT
jgi:hypothetical protein